MTSYIVLVLRVLMAAVLYGFLGWALYTIWNKLRTEGDLLSQRKVPPIVISCERPEPHQVEFQIPDLVIGRDASCDFSVQDDTVSARHARLSYHHNQWWAEDMASTNGTFLNDEQIFTPTVVISGDDLRCGKAILHILFNPRS